MNYQEMSDEQINHMVAIARGTKIKECNGLALHQVSGDDFCANFCNSWADAGPIIQENRISIEADGEVPCSLGSHDGHQWWCASSNCITFQCNYQRNPLRAAMVVFLMMKGGE